MRRRSGRMEDNKMKWRYTFVVLSVFVGWASFAIWLTYRAACTGIAVDIMAASGTNVVLGILGAKWSDSHQFWFRKSKSNNTKSE